MKSNPIPRKGPPTKEFLLLHKKPTPTQSECWEWARAFHGKGYGSIRVNHKTRAVHRVAYELWFGDIPNGMSVLHRCDNPICFNPDHLFLGTPTDNMQDAIKKGRLRPCMGEKHPVAILTEKSVREIRQKHVPYVYTQTRLAKEFKVSQSVIWRIIKRKAWKQVS